MNQHMCGERSGGTQSVRENKLGQEMASDFGDC